MLIQGPEILDQPKFNTTVSSMGKQLQSAEQSNDDLRLSAEPPPPDPAQRRLPPDPSDELACNREELASDSDEFANESTKGAAWEAGV